MNFTMSDVTHNYKQGSKFNAIYDYNSKLLFVMNILHQVH